MRGEGAVAPHERAVVIGVGVLTGGEAGGAIGLVAKAARDCAVEAAHPVVRAAANGAEAGRDLVWIIGGDETKGRGKTAAGDGGAEGAIGNEVAIEATDDVHGPGAVSTQAGD